MASLTLHKAKYGAIGFTELHNQLSEEGFSVFAWQDPPGGFFLEHKHPNDELIVVSSGKIVFTIENYRYELEAGDALELPANTTHSAANEERMPVSYFICTRTPEATA
jgi:quercetin dioxygenase-like cupin family protein